MKIETDNYYDELFATDLAITLYNRFRKIGFKNGEFIKAFY